MQLDVRPFLAALDVFVAPSRTEGLGVSIVEALAAGVPAFGARVGGIPEVIQDGVSGRLLPPDQPEEWARTLVHYARRPEELASLAEGARRRAQAFSLGRSVSDLLRAYEDLMAPPAAGHAEAA
jgi:glycosyltransferase involved in cell wall biosynthesis